MKIIKSFFLITVGVIGISFVYFILMFAMSFLLPEKEKFVPNLKISKKNVADEEYQGLASQDEWYYYQDAKHIKDTAWSFQYDKGNAHFISSLGEKVYITNTHEIHVLFMDTVNSSRERFLVGYSNGSIDVFDSQGGASTLYFSTIDATLPVVFASFIGDNIFSLVLDHDFYPRAVWFSEDDNTEDTGENRRWEESNAMTMKERISNIGKSFIVDNVGIFLNVDSGVLFFSSDMKTVKKIYEFSIFREVLGDNDFYVLEYITGSKLFFDVYINQEKKFSWEAYSMRDLTNLEAIKIVDKVDGEGEEPRIQSDTDLLTDNDIVTETEDISLYRVSREKRLFEFRKGADIYLVEIP